MIINSYPFKIAAKIIDCSKKHDVKMTDVAIQEEIEGGPCLMIGMAFGGKEIFADIEIYSSDKSAVFSMRRRGRRVLFYELDSCREDESIETAIIEIKNLQNANP